MGNILLTPNLKPSLNKGDNSPNMGSPARRSNQTPTLVARRVPYANSIQLTEHVEQFDKRIVPKSTMANQQFRGHGNITASIQESPYTLEDRLPHPNKGKKI